MKRILLCSVFGPYGVDGELSRATNPMQLYKNQVTREQGAFSLEMFHRSWGIMMIQANINSPCVVLDFPDKARFVKEICTQVYDVIGISSIVCNIKKVEFMCEVIRQNQPWAKIVIGGHISNVPDLEEQIDADYIVKGDGIRWFRQFLGENQDGAIKHPVIVSGLKPRSAGISLTSDIAATIIPSVGCPMGCNFCSTSAMFGGKGNWVDFYETGDELFSVMEQVAETLKVCSFFVMDENFLLRRSRALRLLELMEKNDKAWSIYVFTSAKVLKSYSVDELTRLGVSWVWIGLEGKDSGFSKLQGIDTFELVKELQANGIRALGSTIIGLENHTPENIGEVIDYAVLHNTDFHQFMLYTPNPGTELYEEITAKGLMKSPEEYEAADITGQTILPYRHPHFNDQQTAEIMVRAFRRDFEVNGLSVVRIVETTLKGWLKYKNHPDLRVRRRFAWEARNLGIGLPVLVAATKLYYRDNPVMHEKMSKLLQKLNEEFGWKSRLISSLGSHWLLGRIYKEEKRLAQGCVNEPPTFYERNLAAVDRPEVPWCPFVAV